MGMVTVAIAAVFLLVLMAGCSSHNQLPVTPGNGQPDGNVYPQTGDQCAAQPTSPWCAPRLTGQPVVWVIR